MAKRIAKFSDRIVSVMYWSAGEVPHGFHAEVGVEHAKQGRPVDIVLDSGNQSQRLHISLAEARALAKQLAPLLNLREEV